MPKRQPKTSVILTPEARELFATETLGLGLKNGRYFNCDAVEQDGSFLRLTVKFPHSHNEETEPFRISIPIHHVLCTISGTSEVQKRLGFRDDD